MAQNMLVNLPVVALLTVYMCVIRVGSASYSRDTFDPWEILDPWGMNDPKTTSTPPPLQVCKDQCLDLGFIIDGSSSISPAQFLLVKDWLKKIVNKFRIGPDLSQTALVQFAGNIKPPFARVEWNYTDPANTNKSALLQAFTDVSHMTGFTHLVSGWELYLHHVIPTLRTTPPEGCAQLVHAVIFFTDGLPSSRLAEIPRVAQELLNATDGLVFGVAVEVNQNLNRTILEILAGRKDQVFLISQFDQLSEILEQFVDQICEKVERRESTPPTPTTTTTPENVEKCTSCAANSCPRDWYKYSNTSVPGFRCFRLSKTYRARWDAEADCSRLVGSRDQRATLATVTDENVQNFLNDFVDCKHAWIGLGRAAACNENDCWWWDGSRESVNYSNWMHGEPNNLSGQEDCGALDQTSRGQWVDLPCNYEFCYVCELREEFKTTA